MMKILPILSRFLILFFLSMGIVHAEEVAITIDDPNCGDAIYYTHQQRDQKIVEALQKHHIQAAYFVIGSCVDNPEGKTLLKKWDKIGILIGNHTYSHKNFNEMSLDAFENDTLKNEKLLKTYKHYKNILRFPYLKEGNTIAKRDKFRAFLSQHHYINGSVTIDTSDWYISGRLEKRLAENPHADVTLYKKYYLNHMWDRAQYYDNLAKKVLGRSPKHTFLIHHNLLNALFLDDLIQMFKDKGWNVIDANKAFQDPVFKTTPNTLPAGESIIWALAKETGRYDNLLRYPDEDGWSYEKNAMDKLGL